MKPRVMLHIEFDIEISKLSLFTDLLQNEVSNFKMAQNVPGEYSAPAKRSFKTAFDTPSVSAAMELIKRLGVGGIITNSKNEHNLGDYLLTKGFKPTSSSPICSALAKDGVLKRTGRGTYTILKLAI